MLGGDLNVVAALYPPGGLDWARLMADPAEERRYRERIEALFAPDFELMPVQPDGGRKTVIVGIEAYLAGMRVVMEAFDTFRMTPESFIPLDGAVVALVRLEGETVEGPYAFSGAGGAIFELADGLICRVREFDNRPDLLAAAGISTDDVARLAVGSAS
jgi:hypothetical protein